MIFRLSAALVALSMIHGTQDVAQDGAAVAMALRENAPRVAISLCADNPALCKDAAGMALTTGLAAMAVSKPVSKHDVPAIHAPAAAPRRPAKDMQARSYGPATGLDREGLKRAILALG